MSDRSMISFITVMGISLTIMSTDLYLPSMPSMAGFFQVKEDLIQYTIAAYLTGTAIIPFAYGILADHKGRRVTLLLGTTIFLLSSLFCFVTSSLTILIVGRFFQGIGGAAVSVVGIASIKDLYSKEEGAKVMAYHGLIISITPALAPVIGGYIETYLGWRWNFSIIFAFSVLLFLLVQKFYKETMDLKTHKPNKELFATYWKMLRKRRFMLPSLIYPLLFSAILCHITIAPFYMMETIGLSAKRFGWYTMALVFGYSIGAFTNVRIVGKMGVEKVLSCGLGTCTLACLFLILIVLYAPLNAEMLVGTIALFVFGLSFIFAPSTSITMAIFPKSAGAASAVMHMLRMGGAAIGAYAGGVFDDTTLVPLTAYFCGTTALSILIFSQVLKQQKAVTPDEN